VDAQDDIESDLSAFHRIDDPLSIPAPRYFMLANRLGAYTGVIQARAVERDQESREGGHAPVSSPAARDAPVRVSDDYLLDTLSADGWVERG
jgi:hypothetical protein